MRSVSRFVPHFDVLESHMCLSDLAGGVVAPMPTTPGVNLDVYPPSATYLGVPGMPQVPASAQDPNGVFNVPFPQYFQVVPQNAPNPMPYYPPPYSVPTYVGLMSVSPTNVT